MRPVNVADAPPAGWYPDPQRRERLRWWDGTDWADHWRAMPSAAELEVSAALAEAQAQIAQSPMPSPPAASPLSRRDAEEIMAEVRASARSEMDRAAEVFGQRAEAAARQFQPLVTEYSNKILQIIRIGAIVAVIAVVLWILFQVFVQASIFDWLGDRIDNLTDD